MEKVTSSIPDVNSHSLIFGGDLNCTINPSLDRSSPKSKTPTKMARILSSFMHQIGCSDPWRFLFPQSRVFSFFSPVHHSYSRIDYLFIDNALLHLVKNIEYSTIVESDHAPVILDLSFPFNISDRAPWRLDSALLTDDAFCQMISTAIDNFLETNRKDDVSPSLLWQTFKVVIRGDIIAYTSRLNKARRLEQERLLSAIAEIDSQYSATPTPELYKSKLDLQARYELLSSERTERTLLKLRGFIYEHGDKASRLLAHQLKRKSADQQISQICKENGELTTDPLEINDTFKAFYSKLYTSEAPTDDTNMHNFFSNLKAPVINSAHKAELDLPLSLTEIRNAISAMQSGRAPGPDGYPIEFYKKFAAKLTPLILNMFSDSFGSGALPQTLTEASITLIPKPGKDRTQCGSYRPISLLNSDIKMKQVSCLVVTRSLTSETSSTSYILLHPGRYQKWLSPWMRRKPSIEWSGFIYLNVCRRLVLDPLLLPGLSSCTLHQRLQWSRMASDPNFSRYQEGHARGAL